MAAQDDTIAIKNCPHHMPADWAPPVPAYSANISNETKITAIYIGVQNPTREAIWAVGSLLVNAGHDNVEQATFTDRSGHPNRVFIVYLSSDQSFSNWRDQSGLDEFLSTGFHLSAEYGLWCEAYSFQPGQFETLFSTPDSLEGIGRFADHTIGPIREHAYWGGAEDRIPNARPGIMDPEIKSMPEAVRAETRGALIEIQGPHNLCLIRSGQDLTEVGPSERQDYDANIEPALKTGLKFLADTPSTGCFDSRYMKHCDGHGNPIEKTFGMQVFLSIGRLMEWAKSHPTHLDIFNRFQEMAERMQGQFDLRLWHEVAVMPAGATTAIYVNCDPLTGLLPFNHALRSPPKVTQNV